MKANQSSNQSVTYSRNKNFRPGRYKAKAEKRQASAVAAWRGKLGIGEDGSIPETLKGEDGATRFPRLHVAERIIATVLRKIRFPRKGEPVFISETDEADATAAGFLALTEAGFFTDGKFSRDLYKAVRNAISGPECLRLRRNWEPTVSAMGEDFQRVMAKAESASRVIGFAAGSDSWNTRLRESHRDMAREIMRTLRAARESDQSRKRECNFQSHRGFFFILIGELNHSSKYGRELDQQAFRQRAKRFLDYLADGAKTLRAKPFHGRDVAKEITAALQSLTLA